MECSGVDVQDEGRSSLRLRAGGVMNPAAQQAAGNGRREGWISGTRSELQNHNNKSKHSIATKLF